MNNFLVYFYNIDVKNVVLDKKHYSFVYNGYLYKIYLINDNININLLVNINKRLLGYTLISEIIINKNGKYISFYNNNNYMLIKIYANCKKKITLEEISYLANTLYNERKKLNWGELWSKKIDYLEDLISENGKKYPIIVNSFNYFVGMAENAISYYNNIKIENDYKCVISHKQIKIDDTVEALYNPLNIIFDCQARDVAEYIKNAFFLNANIYDELVRYVTNNNLSITDVKLIIARMLYPSFYFEMYEDILIDNQEEKIIVPIIDKLPQYEKYLANVINFFKKYYNIPTIAWLNNDYSK